MSKKFKNHPKNTKVFVHGGKVVTGGAGGKIVTVGVADNLVIEDAFKVVLEKQMAEIKGSAHVVQTSSDVIFSERFSLPVAVQAKIENILEQRREVAKPKPVITKVVTTLKNKPKPE